MTAAVAYFADAGMVWAWVACACWLYAWHGVLRGLTRVDEMKRQKTPRGFALYEFRDSYGNGCSLQKSSLATDDAILLGVDDAKPQVMASQARALGVKTTETVGWIPFPIPEDVLLTTRMHLTREQVAELLPILQRFVETGEI